MTATGGFCLLAGVIMLGTIAGSFDLGRVLAAGDTVRAHPWYPVMLGLILLGALTKSAQFPFHFWLPNAMTAPTPVSAYLHSATLVKLGIYLLARLDPAFNDLLLWETALISAGTLTAVWGAVLALRERDLKRILAWSTVSALGTLTLLIGLPNPGAGLAVAAFLFAHALYKAPLFMVAGNPAFTVASGDLEAASPASLDAHVGCYYLRLSLKDEPGVLAEFTRAFAAESISVHSITQRAIAADHSAQVIVITHETNEAAVSRAADYIARLPITRRTRRAQD